MPATRLWLLLTALGLAACDPGEPARPSDEVAAVASGDARDWRCGNVQLRTEPQGNTDRLVLHLPGGRRSLTQAVAASGARYSEPTGTAFWSKGPDRALLSLPDRDRQVECTPSEATSPWIAAAESGLRARAAGNEPGWILEVSPDGEMHALLDYGEREHIFEAGSSESAAGGRRIVSGDGRATADFVAEACTDSMNGQRFPMRVTLRVGEDSYRGCGRIYERDENRG